MVDDLLSSSNKICDSRDWDYSTDVHSIHKETVKLQILMQTVQSLI
jgi:hypothetical protein